VKEPDAPVQAGSFGERPPAHALAQNVGRNFEQWLRFVAPPPPPNFLAPTTAAMAAGAAGSLAVVIAMFTIDAAGSDWARHLPQGVRDEFEKITDLGLSGWFLFPFGAVLLALAVVTSPRLARMPRGVLNALGARFGFLFLAIAVPGLFVTIVKRLIGRARPFVGGMDDPFAYHPFAWQPAYAALPSGHSTTAVAAAVAIGAIWPRLRWPVWVYAFIIMASRVIVLAHHPSDVIAGAMVGAAGAYLLRRWFAGRRLVFCPRDLRAFPGPSWRRIDRAVREGLRALRTSL
jgi:undecaprenyl-diphosphatase